MLDPPDECQKAMSLKDPLLLLSGLYLSQSSLNKISFLNGLDVILELLLA